MTRFHSIGGNEIEAHYAGGDLLKAIESATTGLTGGGPTDTAAWTYRACPGTDGPATIESIHGNTVVESGELLSVQMEGIETVGFNQWDEEWELGGISQSTGVNSTSSTTIRSKNYIQVMPSATYYFNSPANLSCRYYDSDKNYIGYKDANGTADGRNATRVMPSNACYLRLIVYDTYGTTYNHDICINLSWSGYRNGEYEPYWQSERTIPAATYFPNGMRSAGTVYDELTSDAAVTRVGAVDLGTLDWVLYGGGNEHTFRSSATTPIQKADGVNNLICAEYSLGTGGNSLEDMQVAGGMNSATVYVRNNACTTAAEMKSALSGVILYYELTTPTMQPIDPPLNMTYRAAQGGTERIVHTDPTAPPTLVVTYGSTADGILDRALLAIAPIEGSTASANYGVGSYLIHAGQLCRVTTAIATGEAITIGTNVVATTVMAELLTLTQ